MIRRHDIRLVVACLALVATTVSCAAEADKYHVTAAEKAACTADAIRFCSHTYPDEDQLVSCMKQNHGSLSTVCRVAFDAGIRRRHL